MLGGKYSLIVWFTFFILNFILLSGEIMCFSLEIYIKKIFHGL